MSRSIRPRPLRASAQAAVSALGLLLLLAGCGGGSSAPTEPASSANTDLADVAAGLATSPALLGDDLFDVTTSTGFRARGAAPMAAIEPLSSYRWVSRSTRDFTVAFSDSDQAGRPRAADVIVRRDLTGMLHIVRRPADGAEPDTHNVVHKFMHDAWTRRVHLARLQVDTPQGAQAVWRVTQASGVRIASSPGARTIVSVRLVGSGLDVTVTDPARLQTLAELPLAAAGDSVTVTVDTGLERGDDVFLYWHDQRARMRPHGDGTHTLRFGTGGTTGLRSLGVNVLSAGTLHDDSSDYDSLGWIVPLWVGGVTATVWP